MQHATKKDPTYMVMAGYFDNTYNWKTEFCVPFFNEESAIQYRNDLLKNLSDYQQFVVLPYKSTDYKNSYDSGMVTFKEPTPSWSSASN